MLQLVYISTMVGAPDSADIMAVSRRNNRHDGITGLLYADGQRFMQALEGPAERVEAAFERIRVDPRHRAVVSLSKRIVSAREFGSWTMAERGPDEAGAAFLARVDALIRSADANVRATFDGFVRLRTAA